MKLIWKFFLPIVFILLIVFSIILFVATDSINSNMLREIDLKSQTVNREIINLQELRIQQGKLIADQVILNNDILEKFANKDREGTIKAAQSIYDRYKGIIKQLHFHTIDNKSYIRYHAIDSYGDDLSSFRGTIVKANKTLESTRGLEMGSKGIGIRYVTPLFYKGVHIGSVEASGALNDVFINEIKNDLANNYPDIEISIIAKNLENENYIVTSSFEEKLVDNTPDVYKYLRQNGKYSLLDDKYAHEFYPIIDFENKVIGYYKFRFSIEEEVNKKNLIIYGLIGGSVLILIILLLFISYSFKKNISKKLNKALEVFKKVANGDLTNSIKVKGKDEISILNKSINRIIKNLNQNMIRIKEIAQDNSKISLNLSKSSKENSQSLNVIENVSENLKEANEVLKKKINENNSDIKDLDEFIVNVDNMISDQSADITESSASIEEMSSSINSITKNVRQRTSLVDDLAKITKSGENKMSQNMEMVEKVSNSTNTIIEMLDVVNKLAKKTNMLAMNAAIEGAHAGEAGKGFSVIAEDIRKLAENTTLSTKSISNQISTILKLIEGAEVSSKEAFDAFKQLLDGMSNVKDGMDEIDAAMEELSIGGNQINTALSSLIKSSENINNLSREVKNKMNRLRNTNNEMNSKFETNTDLISDITGKVDFSRKTMEKLKNIEKNNSKSVMEMKVLIEKFKLNK